MNRRKDRGLHLRTQFLSQSHGGSAWKNRSAPMHMASIRHSKTIDELVDRHHGGLHRAVPIIPSEHAENRDLEDPTGKSDEAFIQVIGTMENKIKALRTRQPRPVDSASFSPKESETIHRTGLMCDIRSSPRIHP
ncbi:MAG TPA: hypothetical protein PLX62_07165 [Bacteroidales bacterium]|nr:hypothetical protein [Sphaerochaeta sp.]HQB52670.1 hypothetical protein [Bacteroidales bacterium]